ncbi:MAG: ATPase [Pseudonocardiales bacterium]|nr:MAG: ATPase [Pseudonocardiales bacterium]
MAVDVETAIQIACPRSVVSGYVSNPDNATEWYVNIESVEWKSPRPAVVGSRIAFVAHFLRRRIAYTYEVREFVTGERFVMSTAEGPFPMQTAYTWQDTPSGGTQMTLRNAGVPRGFGRFVAPVMSAAMRRANRKDLKRLKEILEGGRDRAATSG